MTLAADPIPKKKRSAQDDDLITFWDAHASPVYSGLVTGDGWTWNPDSQDYTSDTGTTADQDDLRSLIWIFLLSCELQYEEDMQNVVDGNITVGAWLQQAIENVSAEYRSAAAVAVGGLDNLTPEDERVLQGQPTTDEEMGSGISDAVMRLQNFAYDLRTNQAGSDAQIMARAGMYAQPAYSIYESVRRDSHQRATDDKGRALFLAERNVLDPSAEHCRGTEFLPGCWELSNYVYTDEDGNDWPPGWAPIGFFPDLGTRVCGANDRCHFEFALIPPNAENPE